METQVPERRRRPAIPADADTIKAMKDAFRQFSRGQAELLLRSRLEVAESGGVTLVMPAYLRGSRDLAVRAVSVYPRNPER